MEIDIMKRVFVLGALLTLLALPAAVFAQGDYPMGGGSSGGSSGGGVSVGGGSSGNHGGNHESPGAGAVNIVDFSFQPSAVFINAGDTVTWYNMGEHQHTVT